jgi:hypothetical protein
MTLAEINRMIRAAIRAARKGGAHEVEVKIGDDATVRIPLAPDKPIAGTRRGGPVMDSAAASPSASDAARQDRLVCPYRQRAAYPHLGGVRHT